MNTKLFTTFVPTLVVAALAVSGPSFAQAQSGQRNAAPSQVVRYSDLDLSTAAGIHTLYSRIQDASWRVCRQVAPPQNATRIENLKCRETLIDVAVSEVNKPELTALRTGKSSPAQTARR